MINVIGAAVAPVSFAPFTYRVTGEIGRRVKRWAVVERAL
jgi:hypothetical protein